MTTNILKKVIFDGVESYINYKFCDVISLSPYIPPNNACCRIHTVNHLQDGVSPKDEGVQNVAQPIFALAEDYFPVFWNWFGYVYIRVKIISEDQAKLLYGNVKAAFHENTVRMLQNRGLNPEIGFKKMENGDIVVDPTKKVRQHHVDQITLFEWPSSLCTLSLNQIATYQNYDKQSPPAENLQEEINRDFENVKPPIPLLGNNFFGFWYSKLHINGWSLEKGNTPEALYEIAKQYLVRNKFGEMHHKPLEEYEIKAIEERSKVN